MTQQKRPFWSTSFFVVLGRAGGFAIPLLIALFYGASPETDAYFLAFGIIFFLTTITTHLLESVLVPYLTKHKDDPEKISSFSNGILLLNLIVVFFFWALILIFLKPALALFSGLSEESAQLVIRLFLEMSPLLFLGVLISMTHGIFYSCKIFWLPSLSPIFRSLAVIFFIVFYHQMFGIHGLTGGYVVGEILRLAVSFYFLCRVTSWKPRLQWASVQSEVNHFFKHGFFQALGIVAFNLLFFVDPWFASFLPAGNLSLLNYSDRLIYVAGQIFLIGFLQVFLSYWSEDFYRESQPAFWSKIRRDVRTASLIAIGFALVAWFLRYPVVNFFFRRGGFHEDQLATLVRLISWHIIGFVPSLVGLLYVRVLFVIKKSFIYCVYSWSQVVVKILLTFALMPFYGAAGIAMATAITYLLAALWIHKYMERHHPKKGRLNIPIYDLG